MKVFTVTFTISLTLITAFWLGYDGLKDWQPLVGALLAVTAAVVTVFAIRQQARTQSEGVDKQLEADRRARLEQRARRLMARRALMPADLATMAAYTCDCASVAGNALLMLRNQKARVKLTCPVLPERVLANLQHAIEQMDETDAKAVAALLKCYQIQNSRLAGALSYFNDPNRFGREKIMTERNIEHTFDETVKLSLLIDNMFSFARDDVAHISPAKFSRTQVANNLSVLELQNLISDECRSHLMRTLATENGYGSKSRNSA